MQQDAMNTSIDHVLNYFKTSLRKESEVTLCASIMPVENVGRAPTHLAKHKTPRIENGDMYQLYATHTHSIDGNPLYERGVCLYK